MYGFSETSIVKEVLENLRKDIDEVSSDNKTLAVCGMMINQSFETVLTKLDSSPAFAARLSEPAGLDFSHINLDKGKIGMKIEGDTVTVKMMLGSFVRYFEKHQFDYKPQLLNEDK